MNTRQAGSGLAILLVSAGMCAAEPEAERPHAPGDEIAGLSFTATGPVRFEDPDDPALSGDVSVQESGLQVPFAEMPVGTASLAAGGWAGWTRLDFSGYPNLEAENLYGLALFLAASRLPETGWGWTVLVMPGFYTDFRDGHTGDGKMVFHAAAEYPFSPAFTLNLGVAYDTSFGEPQAYPVGGVIWRILDELTLRLMVPAPSLYWAPASDLGLFALLQPAGDRWIINDETDGDQVFLIESWRAGLGAEHRVWKDLWLRLAGGMDFDRHYEARSGDRSLLAADVDDTWFASVSLVVY